MKTNRIPKNRYWELEFETSKGLETVCIQAHFKRTALAKAKAHLEPSARLIRGGQG